MAEGRLSAAEREAVSLRAGGCCEYCLSQSRFAPDSFSVEHVIPRFRGGSDEPDNLALSCQGCNNHKYTAVEAVDPVTGDAVPLYHPRRDRWADHFVWTEGFTQIIGLTPTGRATVERLALNRPGVVNLRAVLRDAGKHPPPPPPPPPG